MSSTLSHVAIIMDGNGRWAQKQHQQRTFGHRQGVENVRNIAVAALREGVKVLTLYAFSTENWKRPLQEIDFLMKLPGVFFDKFLKELMELEIKIDFIGHFEKLPKNTAKVISKAMEVTKHNQKMTLVFAMDYGGRDELVMAMRQYAHEVSQGRANDLDEHLAQQYLMTSKWPDVDLLIRTSHELRISNFLLWQIAYAELCFVEQAWPEFSPEVFKQCIDEYHLRQRRFGGLTE